MPPTRKRPPRVVDLDGVRLGKRIGRHDRVARHRRGRRATARRTPRERRARMASIFRLTPITPVDATSACAGAHPTRLAASTAISRASAMPCGPVQALAQPLLVTMTCADAAAPRQVLLRDEHRRRLGLIGGEDAAAAHGPIGGDQREVGLAAGLDAARDPRGAKASGSGDAAVDRVDRARLRMRTVSPRARPAARCTADASPEPSESTTACWPHRRNSGQRWQSSAIFSGTQTCGTIEKPRRTK